MGLVSWGAFGLNLGIDFKGGGQLQYRLPYDKRPAAGQDVALLQEARTLLEKQGLQRSKLQLAGGDTLVIATDARDDAELRGQQRIVEEALKQRFSGKSAEGKSQDIELVGRQLVGPVIGKELRDNAVKGVFLGVLLIAAWICLRYSFNSFSDGLRYAVAGVIALIHDVFVLIGLFALIGHFFPSVEIDGAFIAALLTVVGYSINDSVVIFDRLRENLRVRRREPFDKVVNDSLLETMSRSINTGLTVLIMLFVMLLLGGESIFNFILAMLVGIASGLYSSIFNASMVLVAWHHWDEKKALTARAARSGGRSGSTVTVRDTTQRPSLSGAARPRLSTQGAGATEATRPAGPTVPTNASTDSETRSASAAPAASTNIVEPGISSSATEGGAASRPPRKSRAKRRF